MKKIFACALCVVMTVSLCSCAGCRKKEETKAKEKETIELWHYWDIPDNQRHLEELVEQFNKMQEDIEIEVSYIPDEDFKKQLALAMSEEKMPDIAVVDSSDFQFLHHMKAFADLTDAIPELKEYNEKALEPCTIDGRIYGQPFGVNCTGMFYNKKLLEENGCEVPESWEEFQETAAKISNEDVKGFAITALQTEESMYEFLPILWSMGGDVHRITEENSKKAFLLLDQMEKEGSLSLQSISLTMGDLTNQFLKGKIGIMFNSSMAIDSIREGNPDLEFGVAPIPGGETSVSVAGGEILAVAENEKKEYAIRFLKFLADKDRMKEYIDAFGFLAPRQDIMEQQFAEDPEKRTFIKMYKAAGIREISPEWPRISLTLSDTLRQILVEEEDPQTILNKSAEKIEKIGTKAFAGCSSLVEINFYPETVPVIEDKLFGDMDTSKITVNTLSNALGYYVIREKENVTVQRGLKSRHIHTMQYHETVSATCEKTGTVAYYSCSGCGKLYYDEQGISELKESALTVPALGHAWESDYTIDKPATKNTAGEKSIHCMRCDARTDIQTIPATGGSDDQNGSDSNSGNNNSGTSGEDSSGSNTSTKKKYPKKGKKVTVKGIRYKVTGVVAKTKKFEVSCTGSTSKKITKLSIPEYVIISGIKFKVTAIEKKAFYKYTKLKTVTIGKNVKTFGTQAFAKSSKISKITIKTTKLTKKSVGKNVFSGIKKKAKFTYPKSKKAVYKKIFKA
mgnify:CR=1 FL=1